MFHVKHIRIWLFASISVWPSQYEIIENFHFVQKATPLLVACGS